MRNIERNIAIEKFIRTYLSSHPGTDVLDAEFHDGFTDNFGGKQILKSFGACPNMLAMRWLKKLYDQGILNRARISLIEHETGFPNWVYTYALTNREVMKL